MNKRSRATKALCMLAILSGLASAQNLLVNGDFEQPLTVGWTTSGSGRTTVDRATNLHPDPDFEARCSVYAGGWARLDQVVDVPSPVVELSFWAKFGIGNGSVTCWPAAAVVVEYRDSDGVLLGETRIYHHDANCRWTNSPTFHLIEVTNPDWRPYNLSVVDEIVNNLPGVSLGDVRKIQVALYSYTSGS